jgi:hypothetical protein
MIVMLNGTGPALRSDRTNASSEFVAFNNERIDHVDRIMEGFKTGGID